MSPKLPFFHTFSLIHLCNSLLTYDPVHSHFVSLSQNNLPLSFPGPSNPRNAVLFFIHGPYGSIKSFWLTIVDRFWTHKIPEIPFEATVTAPCHAPMMKELKLSISLDHERKTKSSPRH